MSTFLGALLPVILIVAAGRLIASRNWVSQDGFRAMERLSYLVLLPALIIRALANAPFDQAPWKLAVALIAGQLVMGLIGLSARFVQRHDRPAIGSIIQSNVRWQTFVALSLGGSLFGDEGLALVAIAAAALIPTANILSVYGLVAHADHPEGKRPKPLLALLKNPLLIACAIGGIIAVLPMKMPAIADETLRITGQAAIGIGLLSAGAGVDIDALKRAGPRTLVWSLVRLLGLPLFVGLTAYVLQLSGTTLLVAIICAATPTATNGYILARELGGDAPLSANLIAVQTLLAMMTLPLVWWLAQITASL